MKAKTMASLVLECYSQTKSYTSTLEKLESMFLEDLEELIRIRSADRESAHSVRVGILKELTRKLESVIDILAKDEILVRLAEVVLDKYDPRCGVDVAIQHLVFYLAMDKYKVKHSRDIYKSLWLEPILEVMHGGAKFATYCVENYIDMTRLPSTVYAVAPVSKVTPVVEEEDEV